MTMLADEIRRSRKRRWCLECGRPIQIGEHYRYQFGDGDGSYDMGSWQCCEQCDVLRSAIWRLPDVYRFGESFEIRDGGAEHIRETNSIPLRRALAWQRRKWVRADGTPLPTTLVREMLGLSKEQAA